MYNLKRDETAAHIKPHAPTRIQPDINGSVTSEQSTKNISRTSE